MDAPRDPKLLSPMRTLQLAAVLLLLCLTLLGACSTEESGRGPDETRGGATPAGSAGRAESAEASPKALVPIAHLTSTRQSVSEEELSRSRDLAVPREAREPAAALLDRRPARRGFEGPESTDEVVDHVSRTPEALGLVPWDAVVPSVKALAVEGEDLFDPGAPQEYPLRPEGGTGPEDLRRLVFGGDIVLDRGQYYAVIEQGRGLDFPLDGGYAAVTGRVAVPSSYSEYGVIHEFTAERRGGEGAVREYLRSADLALANFENPVIESSIYHPDEPTFTGDLRLLPILERAGIDGVTLGNNHILDAGAEGLEETMAHLDEAGIAHTGAGMDLEAARRPMVFDLDGTRVGVLNYQGVPSYDWAWATGTAPGTAPLQRAVIVEDIERLRPEVDVLVVMPHWGSEYLATPEPDQVELAHAMVDAGADLVVGGHAHWPKGIELHEGRPVFYGVGNFLLDQSWSEETSTGIFAEITLQGGRVVQARPIPFILLDYAQPNFLVPEGGKDRALERIFDASLGPEFRSGGAPR